MHIAFLTPEFPHEKVAQAAGIGTSVKNLATALVRSGVKVTVFVYGQKTQEILSENGITIHLIKNKKYKFFGWYFYRKSIEKYCNYVISREKINLLEAADWTGITAFMNIKAAVVIRFHGSDTYFCHLENRKQKRKNFWFEKMAIDHANAFIAPTNFAGELSKRLFKIEGKEIKTIYNGLDFQNFENQKPMDFDENSIFYIGTLIRKKGVLELPEIFKKVKKDFPDAKLVLIGADSFDAKTNSKSTWELMKNLFKEDLTAVEYLGKITYAEVQSYIRKATVCVFPSFAETFGMVTIETMALQKPVVNTNFGWAQELIVDEESGFLVHPENHDLYAQRIVSLLKNEALCNEIGKQARIRVEQKFNIEKLVIENINFYKEVIGKNIGTK